MKPWRGLAANHKIRMVDRPYLIDSFSRLPLGGSRHLLMPFPCFQLFKRPPDGIQRIFRIIANAGDDRLLRPIMLGIKSKKAVSGKSIHGSVCSIGRKPRRMVPKKGLLKQHPLVRPRLIAVQAYLPEDNFSFFLQKYWIKEGMLDDVCQNT